MAAIHLQRQQELLRVKARGPLVKALFYPSRSEAASRLRCAILSPGLHCSQMAHGSMTPPNGPGCAPHLHQQLCLDPATGLVLALLPALTAQGVNLTGVQRRGWGGEGGLILL